MLNENGFLRVGFFRGFFPGGRGDAAGLPRPGKPDRKETGGCCI